MNGAETRGWGALGSANRTVIGRARAHAHAHTHTHTFIPKVPSSTGADARLRRRRSLYWFVHHSHSHSHPFANIANHAPSASRALCSSLLLRLDSWMLPLPQRWKACHGVNDAPTRPALQC